MTEAEQQGALWPEINVEHHWFHIVRAMILRGRIAEMGANAWAVYCIIKGHTDLNSGKAFPSQDRIADLAGMSVDSVARATDRLIELGIVSKTKRGRVNEYRLVEEIPMTLQGQDEVIAKGTRDYAPMAFQNFVHQIKEFAERGLAPTDGNIKIVLNVNFIQQGDNSTVNLQQVTVTDDAGNSNDTYRRLADKLKNL